jgi:hypothetical protein
MHTIISSPANTSLTIAVTSPLPEKPSTPQEAECTIEATLKDEYGNPLPNMDIHFYECGATNRGIAKTDSTGVASLKYIPFEAYFENPPRTATYKFNAVFKGTANYAQSSSEDIYIEYIFRDIDIFLDYGSYLVGGGIITVVSIIGVAGYIVFRRRKKGITS